MIRTNMLAVAMLILLGIVPAMAKNGTTEGDATPPAASNVQNAAEPAAEPADDSTPQISDSALGANASSIAPNFLPNFGPSSGTAVGNRARELRDEILRLRASVNLNSNEFAILRSSGAAGAVQYHSTVAAITARLQNGTTRGNPILLRQWDEANASLDEVTSSLNRLNSLSTAIDADASMGSYLSESVQAAFQLSGAVDEDHDQLKLLKDEINRLVVQLDYLRNQTANDIQRQTTYLTTERSNLQALAFAISRGELLGSSFANRPVIVNQAPFATMPPAAPQQTSFELPPPQAAPTSAVMPGTVGPAPMSPREIMHENGTAPAPTLIAPATVQAPAQAPAQAPVPAATTSNIPQSIGQLLVLIRYDQPHVEYEQQLSQAVGAALERRPNAEFSVVAVSPSVGDSAELAHLQQTAQTNADTVRRSLVQLGLSPSHISVATTQMPSAQTPEVHIYIR